MRALAAILFLCAATAMGADAFPVARRGGLLGNLWTNAGVMGGHRIEVTTIYTNISDTAITAAQLNTVIGNCPSNQVIKFAAGSYTGLGSTGIILNKDGVVVRGTTNANGHPTTLFTSAGFKHFSGWYPSGPVGGWPSVSTRTITAGLTEGSTSITVSSAPNGDFGLGDVFLIDQTVDGALVSDDSGDDTYTRDTRPYVQALIITATNATTISFTPPLVGTYWDTAARTPQAVGWSSSVNRTVKRVGIEDIDFSTSSSPDIYTLCLGSAIESWVYNCRLIVKSSSAVRFSFAVNCAITACVFRDSTGDGSSHYGISTSATRDCRWENNICTNASLFIITQGGVGDSTSYNFSQAPYPYSTSTWLAEHLFAHGSHTHHSLWEGNHLPNVEFDDVYHNNNSDCGFVRNRLIGWSSGKTGNCNCLFFGENNGSTNNHRNMTVLGCALGENSFHGTYASLWSLNTGNTGLIRTNNYNTVNDAVPSSEGPGSDTVAGSYAYASKPAWFGDRPWPPYGPDAASVASGSETNIPAGFRATFGFWPASAAGGGGSVVLGSTTTMGPNIILGPGVIR